MKNVIVTIPLSEEKKNEFRAVCSECEILFIEQNQVTQEQVAQADIIIGSVAPSLLKASERLEYFHLNTAGADAYMGEGILNRHTVLTNSTGAYNKAVAEHALATTLMLQKKLHLYRDDQMASTWADEGTVTSITDSTVLIVGMGAIGAHYAKLVKALGGTVIGVKRRASACPDYLDELHLTENLEEILPRADVVVSFLPGTPATKHMFNEELFSKMKKSAVFINCGRGNVVSLETLEKVLKNNVISAAGVDVLEVEPLPADSPLWKLRNLVITPHVSGWFHLHETYVNVVNIALDNYKAWITGGELKNLVDYNTGYKA